jgi:hypothetical protein
MGAMIAFDACVMVDWSANSRPKTGKDSVWWCVASRESGGLRIATPVNSRTRAGAVAEIAARLKAMVSGGRSVLVGFDFPYAYPRGFAAALGLAGEPWRAVWNELSALVRDDQLAFTNNRFQVAASLNRRLAGGGRFWGCPRSARCTGLEMTKGEIPPGVLGEFRVAEARIHGPKSCWQLFYNGSVGSQALLGIPHLATLRDDPHLASLSAVWPFETGAMLPPRVRDRARIVHAEIYPSAISAVPAAGEVKDSAQVRTLAGHFMARDATGELAADFAAPAVAGDAWREEGWILGVR